MQQKFWRGALAPLMYSATLALAGCGGSASSSSPSSPSSSSMNYAVGGTVSGLGAGDSVTLLNNGGDALVVSGDGAFAFSTTHAAGSAYDVTVQSHTPGIACPVSNGSGTLGSSDVTGIAVSCAAGTETILYSFGTGATDGTNPQAGLIMDGAGNLYGTTYEGGAIGVGTVFKISASGTETILYSFGTGTNDGGNPQAALVMDSAGNLYGTTSGSVGSGYGTVFKLSAAGTETVLHTFAGMADGAYPRAGVIMDSAGNLYGTTSQSGAGGTVFEISTTGTETILHTFVNNANDDGWGPEAGLVMDNAGSLYGTTINGVLTQDFGTVFKISAAGMESLLYNFSGTVPDGATPQARMVMDGSGNLYGTTTYGGYGSNSTPGTVFKLTAAGKESILHFFAGGTTDGAYPRAGLVIDGDGNLYGTTSFGGTNNLGIVFKISPAGTESVLHSFSGAPTDGNEPLGDLIMDAAGNLYGTTDIGGANDAGTVFKID